LIVARHSMTRLSSLSVCLILFFIMVGCSETASEVECDQAYDHLIAVRTGTESAEIVKKIKATELEKNRPIFLKECVGRTSKSVLACWNAAETTQAMRECEVSR